VLIDVLGTEFDGVLGCDYFSSYRRIIANAAWCSSSAWRTLIRDVKFLTTLPDPQERAYGERLIGDLRRRLFEVTPSSRQVSAPASSNAGWRRRGPKVLQLATQDVPARAAAGQRQTWPSGSPYMGRAISVHHDPRGEPTNNLAEQAIRFVVIDRPDHAGDAERARATAGCERIWTVNRDVQSNRPTIGV